MWNQRWIQRCPSACLQSKFVLPSFWLEEQGWDLQEIPMPPGASCRQCWLRTSLLSPFSPRICFLKSWGAKKLLGDPKAGGPTHGHRTVPLCIMQWRWRSCVGSALEPLQFNSPEENKTNSSKSHAELCLASELTRKGKDDEPEGRRCQSSPLSPKPSILVAASTGSHEALTSDECWYNFIKKRWTSIFLNVGSCPRSDIRPRWWLLGDMSVLDTFPPSFK